MSWFGRAGYGVLLAGALVFAGSLGCEGSKDKGDDGAGGDDGTELPCGGRTCGEGQSCNAVSDRCECTTTPTDSCAPFNKVCSSGGVCGSKPPPAQAPAEFAPCDRPDTVSEDEVYYCAALSSGGSLWARLCQNSSHCSLSQTVCLPGVINGEVGLCWFNFCGDAEDQNGEEWGACDTATGRLTNPATASGTCLPEMTEEGVVFLCNDSGPRAIDESCRQGTTRGETMGCGQDLACLGLALPGGSCETDAGCSAAETCSSGSCVAKSCSSHSACGTGNYCLEGKCAAEGRCVEICNGGSLGDEAGPFAGCSSDDPSVSPKPSCSGGIPLSPDSLESFIAFCRSSCDPFGDVNECAGDEDASRVCVASPNPRAYLDGTCIEVPGAETVGLGEECDELHVCANGQFCNAIDDTFRCMRLCECEGAGGWDSKKACKTTSAQCTGEAVCTSVRTGNPKLGVCIGELADEEGTGGSGGSEGEGGTGGSEGEGGTGGSEGAGGAGGEGGTGGAD